MTGQATNASSMKPSQIQVIYQGKIATPQSLLRKSGTEASSSSASSQKNKKKVPPKALGIGQTIDENATEHTDKEKLVSQQSMASRLSRRLEIFFFFTKKIVSIEIYLSHPSTHNSIYATVSTYCAGWILAGRIWETAE